MLKTHQRLRQSRDITHVYKNGKRCVAPHGVFFVYRKKNDKAPSRWAVVIGKKYALKAVARNHVRRIIQAALRDHATAVEGYDIVVGYTKKEQVLSYKDAVEDVEYFLHICK